MLNTDLTKKILEIQDIQALKPDFSKLSIIDEQTAQKIELVIFDGEQHTLRILTTNNFPTQLQQVLDRLANQGYKRELFYTDPNGFQEALKRYTLKQAQDTQVRQKVTAEKNAAGNAALAMIKTIFDERSKRQESEFVIDMVRLAFQAGASDLHFQSEEQGVIVRVRIDGVLHTILEFSHTEFKRYLQALKFMAGTKMNIDYVPQDGRFSFTIGEGPTLKKVDARVSFMPGIQDESTVIRFLDSVRGIRSFEEIGFTKDLYTQIIQSLQANTGMILVTGPTGSGKTTSLYTMLNHLNTGDKKIITLEDPIEYLVPGLQQSQINYAKGYDYATGLKAILRQDPEVILIGEIRVGETAEIATNAALTGHLVFSTLHTNSAIEAIPRILSMGMKPYMFAPALNTIVGQRLCRKLCTCATRKPAEYAQDQQIKEMIQTIKHIRPKAELNYDGTLMTPAGCKECNGTGYKGRIAIIEILNISPALRQFILENKGSLDIYAKAREEGFLTFQEDGLIKILEGFTTLDELRRVI